MSTDAAQTQPDRLYVDEPTGCRPRPIDPDNEVAPFGWNKATDEPWLPFGRRRDTGFPKTSHRRKPRDDTALVERVAKRLMKRFDRMTNKELNELQTTNPDVYWRLVGKTLPALKMPDTSGDGVQVVHVRYLEEGSEAELDEAPPQSFTHPHECARWMHMALTGCMNPAVIREQAERAIGESREMVAGMLRTCAGNLETVAHELDPLEPEPALDIPDDLLQAAARIAALEGLLTSVKAKYGVEAD